MLIVHLRQYPEAVLKGLEIIQKSTQTFIQAAIETGIDGIFYAIQHAQSHLLTSEEFKSYSLPSDLELLRAASPLWCNMVHLHGLNVLFEEVASLPTQILNWHDRETSWSLGQGLGKFAGTVCGGLRRETVILGSHEDVLSECKDAIQQTHGKRFILGTGCVVPITAPYGNIMTVRKSVESSL
jgi:uroporphyrinogen decarboxylase